MLSALHRLAVSSASKACKRFSSVVLRDLRIAHAQVRSFRNRANPSFGRVSASSRVAGLIAGGLLGYAVYQRATYHSQAEATEGDKEFSMDEVSPVDG